jgi:hypothetical protein
MWMWLRHILVLELDGRIALMPPLSVQHGAFNFFCSYYRCSKVATDILRCETEVIDTFEGSVSVALT